MLPLFVYIVRQHLHSAYPALATVLLEICYHYTHSTYIEYWSTATRQQKTTIIRIKLVTWSGLL